MPHKELKSKSDFEAAIATPDKYVLIYAYAGEVHAKAEEAADKYAHNTEAYKVNVDENPGAREQFKDYTLPAVIIFKNGEKIKTVEGVNAEKAKEIQEVLQ